VLQRALGQYLESRKDIGGQLDKLRDQLGVDLRKDLHGLTLYGKKIGRSEGVLIVHVDVDQKTLLGLVRFTPDHKMSGYGPYEVHSWTDGKGKKEERPVSAAFFRPTVVVLTASVDELKAALDVLDAKSPVLAGKESPLAAAVPAGTVVAARAIGLADAELPYKSPLVTQTETFSVVAGVYRGELFAEARLVARSPELAAQVRSIAEGARAMAELQRSQDQAAVKLLKQIKIRGADKRVEIEFRAPAEEAWAWVERESRLRLSPASDSPKK
jgi:hypothetical protein